ncbi:unnamed protein product [Paramecium primaurelia]|uniref:Protein kinase domain-containing protein n=2 Tax=Paramecium TaxID=5884 RepID=A0A8S1YAK8_9CILI|nr:unnamed protein product [Paramecium primaurelia]CAD8211496.1 unnamed protein product [Paramecium pentaurelia]
MRQKSRTVHEGVQNTLQSVDYNECIYQCILTKKKFIGKSPRYIYLFKNHICIGKSPKVQIPERQFAINTDTRIQWQYSKNMLKSITFQVGSHSYEYFGSNEQLREIKQKFALYAFQMKIQDEYQAESVLGKGSYATVLELTNLYNNQQYAAKCIDQQKINEKKNGYRQLMQEIETMRILSEHKHKNILQLNELYIGNQNYYLVMELAKGGSLLSLMKKRSTLFSRNDIRIIMRQLLEGLKFIHSFNIMHRDLKPENILFMSKDLESLKIADFGLAQSCDQHPYTYPKCGTPGFVAPEILEQDSEFARYTTVCDIFSAGVILYVLLVGEPLFEKKDRREQLELNRRCEINFQRFTQDQLDDIERDLISKMLAKNPNHRWKATELLKHKFFVPSDDQIENEIDYPKQINMAILKKSAMPTFSKNPFMQSITRDKALTTREQSQTLVIRPKNCTLIMQTNLQFDKSSQEQINPLEKLTNFIGSFNLIKDEINQ